MDSVLSEDSLGISFLGPDNFWYRVQRWGIGNNNCVMWKEEIA